MEKTPMKPDTLTSSTYWKSLDEKYNTEKHLKELENEFLSSPLKEDVDEAKEGLARRQFMKLMGASLALSTTACVRRPVQKIIPYNKRPPEVIPGVANYYASSYFDGFEGFPLTIKTREGRPLHVEGMPDGEQRGLSLSASAQILKLYDPDRIKGPTINSQNPKKRGNALSIVRTWEDVDKKVVEQLKKGGVHFLLKDRPSPTYNDLLDKFVRAVSGEVAYWSPMNLGDVRRAQSLSYGQDLVPRYRFDKAKTIVSVDGDFLGAYLSPAEFASQYASGRDPEGDEMSRLVSFQSVPSLTSMNADDNFAVKPSQQLPLVLGMLHELLFAQSKSPYAGRSEIRSITQEHEKIYLALGLSHEEFAKIVGRLWEHRGASLVIAGGLATQTVDSLGLQVAVNLLNSALGNDGTTVQFMDPVEGSRGSNDSLARLTEKMKNGGVKTLIVDEMNPIYSLPDSAGFAEALGKVEMVISLSNWMDETASFADIVAPRGHDFENWGDFQFRKGQYHIQQPTIQPLHDTRSFSNSMIQWASGLGSAISDKDNDFDHLKSRWMQQLGSEKAWFHFLQKGSYGSTTAFGASSRNFNMSALGSVKVTGAGAGVELALYSKSSIGDGSNGNVSWLQELADPVSKIAWDNYLHMSPARAKEMKIKEGDVVAVTVGQATLDLPVYISPGIHKDTVAVSVGYGRRQGGEIVAGIGVDVSSFIAQSGTGLVFSGLAADIKKTGRCYELAQTQGHHSMEGRQIVGEASHDDYKNHKSLGLHKHKIFSIWGKHSYDGHRWGMSVDLNTCTGCSVCTVACQSENNVPVVGKKYLLQGRAMSWIRIDRYFKGDEAHNPDTVFQPVMCQHCENAPCETVCPVLATVHSSEGLNDMSYNRCVGTRYCANNCPYKVRRFNWFYYDSHHKRAPLEMALNPDVTVRSRGVMEKCTMCVQRIKESKNIAKDEGRKLKDGDIRTACEAACPTRAITFGDFNDSESRLAKLVQSKREYSLLEEVHTVPRVRYLGKIRNTDRVINHSAHGHGDDHGDDQGHSGGEHGGDDGHDHGHGH